jgi:hypothetical protein
MSAPSADLLDRLVEEREHQSPAVPLRLPSQPTHPDASRHRAPARPPPWPSGWRTLAETDDRQMRHVPLSPQDEPQNGCRTSPAARGWQGRSPPTLPPSTSPRRRRTPVMANVMHASSKPLRAAALGEVMGVRAWKTQPSSRQIAAFGQRSDTGRVIHSASSQETSLICSQRCSPSGSRNLRRARRGCRADRAPRPRSGPATSMGAVRRRRRRRRRMQRGVRVCRRREES